VSTDTLEGCVVAVAGAGGSLGPVVVRRLGAARARVALAGRDAARLEAAADAARAGADVTAVDLMSEPSTRAWADGVAARLGGVDAVLHLVGGWRGGAAIEDAPLDDWDALSGALVRTVQHTSRAFLPHLLASGRGRFAIVSSSQAQAPSHTNAVYASAKAAAEAWTLALAHRLKGTGSTANIVVVGAIATAAMRAAEPERDFSAATPAEDIAEALAYLCSPGSGSMNGQRLVLRGAV
jgi:NAD(P)-dependent dehydrogenase (short-subunit alcohol dehydrogenase family)